ncbi:MAG: tyrosine-type recombinase/integrase [Burkholderiales bacterium]
MTPIYTTTRATIGPASPTAAARTNRRRRWVFVLTLLIALASSLFWVYSRPAQYQASARWQFTFPDAAPEAAAAGQHFQGASPQFLTELQVITSRPLLKQLGSELHSRSLPLPMPVGLSAATSSTGDAAAVDLLQRSLHVLPVAGTNVVEVFADGLSSAPLAPAVNVLFDVYRQNLDARHQSDTGDSFDTAREEASALQQRVDQARREANAFRARHNIVSLDADDSQVLSQVRGQAQAANTANEKLVRAEAKMRVLREAAAAGRSVARAADNPTLASLENRLSQAREELRVMERQFTDAYMKMDANGRALRARVTNLDEQLRRERGNAQGSALAEAEEELASARLAAERINQQMTASRQSVQAFTSRLGEYQQMQQELRQLEGQRAAAALRATSLETGARRAAPTVRLLDPASEPLGPARPDYTRDAAIAAGGSLLLALLAVGLVELLTRTEDPPELMMERSWGAIGPAAPGMQPLGWGAAPRVLADQPLAAGPAPLLEAPPLPRDLDPSEVAALLAAVDPPVRALLMALLSGLTAEEAAALCWGDVDLVDGTIRLPERSLPLPAVLAAALARGAGDRPPADAPVFAGAEQKRQSGSDIDATVLFAAHDASLSRPDEVDAQTLRHTCVVNLVRQGARFGDLSRWVGRLAPDALGVYARYAPPTGKRPAELIDPVLPALRRAA